MAQYNVNDAGTQTTVTDVSQINTGSVPEPSSASLLIAGAIGLLALNRRRNRTD
ncbi:PEP-CTERM sorting domain-containing protein [bacterium]|nr:PEP-CTERM sorting domain-containing protein [bacterium]